VALDGSILAALAGTVVGFALALAMLARFVQLSRQSEVARAPIAAEHDVGFGEHGPVELAIEGPFFGTRLRGLAFTLLDPGGRPLPLEPLWLGGSSGGVTRARLSLHRVAIPAPGRYGLRIAGIAPGVDYTDCAIVFVRPRGRGVATTVATLVVAVTLTAASGAIVAARLQSRTPPEPAPVASAPVAARAIDPPVVDAHGGRPLAADPARLDGAQEIEWPGARLRARVPRDWEVQKLTQTAIDVRDPASPSTSFVGRASPMPAGPTAAEYLRAQVEHAASALAARRIEGYATRRLGIIAGVTTIERPANGASVLVTWTGFASAVGGAVSVKVLLGAAAADFESDEGLLGAILDSIRIE
jgi:hypothetical protein